MSLRNFVLSATASVSVILLPSIAAWACATVIRNPTVNGYGLDYCREWAQNCGMPAARAYCEARGYDRAAAYMWAEDNQKTRVINGGQVCDADYCDRITVVVCE